MLAIFGLLLTVSMTLFALGWTRLAQWHGISEYICLYLLLAAVLFFVYMAYRRYFMLWKRLLLLIGIEIGSLLLLCAFACIDNGLLDLQITGQLLKAFRLDGCVGDERGLNIAAVLCGVVYPLLWIGCGLWGWRMIKQKVFQ